MSNCAEQCALLFLLVLYCAVKMLLARRGEVRSVALEGRR
jgi:hypothetical protein